MASFSFSRSTISSDSETETIDDIDTTKKNQRQTPLTRSNQSHTSFFYRIEADDLNIAYCKICEINFEGTNKTAYGYS
jgi:hypothetical protein